MTGRELRKKYFTELRGKYWSDIDDLIEELATELEERDYYDERTSEDAFTGGLGSEIPRNESDELSKSLREIRKAPPNSGTTTNSTGGYFSSPLPEGS